MRMRRLLAVLSGLVITAGSLAVTAGCSGCNQSANVEPPAAEYKVRSVSVQYNGSNVNGTLSVDLSERKISLDAVVSKDEEADGKVSFSSSVKEVADVDANGVVTLKSAGETVITAECGGKKYEFVLIVGDSSPRTTYAITVNGGSALDSEGNVITSAEEGAYITLSSGIDVKHNIFTGWNFGADADKLWQNGNLFKMPAHAITVSAEQEAILYTLKVVGGIVAEAGEEVMPDGTDGGYSPDGTTDEYKITEYKIAYNEDVTLKAIDDPDGKMFVGWDYGVQNNRTGELGQPVYEFGMADETTTVWAVYTELTKGLLNGCPGAYNNAGRGYKTITNGTPAGEDHVEEFGVLNGFRLAIAGNTTRNAADWPGGSGRLNFDNITQGNYHGRYLCKAVFRNHSDKYAVTVEIGAEYNGLYFLSGEIEIQPGETHTEYFLAEIGFERPDGGITVRRNVGGREDETVLLDMVVGCAPYHADVDGRFTPSGIPEYVTLNKWLNGNDLGVNTDGSWTSWRPMFIDNDFGISTIMMPGSLGSGKFIGTAITNMPDYDAANPVTEVYVKIINLFSHQYNFGGKDLRISFGTGKDPAQHTVTADFRLKPGEETLLFKFEIPRTAADNGEYYVHFYNPAQEGAFGLCVQMTYNNVFGYEEA